MQRRPSLSVRLEAKYAAAGRHVTDLANLLVDQGRYVEVIPLGQLAKEFTDNSKRRISTRRNAGRPPVL